MNPHWHLIALLAFAVLIAFAYGEIENRLDPEYGPELPENWDTQILRIGFWWSVKGYYVGPEFDEPTVAFSYWSLTRKSAVGQVSHSIFMAQAMPSQWMPEAQS